MTESARELEARDAERRQSSIHELVPARPKGAVRPRAALRSSLAPDASARRLVEALVERGVDTFFGIPGGPVCPVFEAIRLTPGARLVESRHESHAGFAATLYYRASGQVPAVVVTAGPGATNAVTGIASASLERTPMLVIAGDVARRTTGERIAQDSGPEGIALESILRPVTRIQVRSARAQSVVSQALAALEAAKNPLYPGPALFVLPLDHAMQPCDVVDVSHTARRLGVGPPRDVVAQTVRWLSGASRPLIVLLRCGRACTPRSRSMHASRSAPISTIRRWGRHAIWARAAS